MFYLVSFFYEYKPRREKPTTLTDPGGERECQGQLFFYLKDCEFGWKASESSEFQSLDVRNTTDRTTN